GGGRRAVRASESPIGRREWIEACTHGELQRTAAFGADFEIHSARRERLTSAGRQPLLPPPRSGERRWLPERDGSANGSRFASGHGVPEWDANRVLWSTERGGWGEGAASGTQETPRSHDRRTPRRARSSSMPELPICSVTGRRRRI